MPRKEAPLSSLSDFLPPGTFEPVMEFLQHYKVHLTVARERKSILGDYRHSHQGKNHRISVNGNLNKYSFLITLLHELAHLIAFELHGNRIAAHGKEWKSIFGKLLVQFVDKKVFPADIQSSLKKSIHNPAASSCADEDLLRVLKRYDENVEGKIFVEALAEGAVFSTDDGRIFRKGEKMRKRFRCEEIATKKVYLFSPVYEVREKGY